MNLHDIEETLRRFDRDIDDIREAFDKEHAGFESVVEEKYRALKEEFEYERNRSHSDKRNPTQEMLTFYDPAINEVWLELRTRSGSPPSPKMIDELSSASGKLKYYLLELSKHQAG